MRTSQNKKARLPGLFRLLKQLASYFRNTEAFIGKPFDIAEW